MGQRKLVCYLHLPEDHPWRLLSWSFFATFGSSGDVNLTIGYHDGAKRTRVLKYKRSFLSLPTMRQILTCVNKTHGVSFWEVETWICPEDEPPPAPLGGDEGWGRGRGVLRTGLWPVSHWSAQLPQVTRFDSPESIEHTYVFCALKVNFKELFQLQVDRHKGLERCLKAR